MGLRLPQIFLKSYKNTTFHIAANTPATISSLYVYVFMYVIFLAVVDDEVKL